MYGLKCPRGLQEADFVDMLRSTFPQLAAGEPFDVLTVDRSKRLQPLKVDSLTPEKLYRAIKMTGNMVVFIRLKVLRLTVDVFQNATERHYLNTFIDQNQILKNIKVLFCVNALVFETLEV